ncbi:MAG: hypothetical protein WBW53_17845 [Terriglobales bacterium]
MGRVFRFAQPLVFCVGTLLMFTGAVPAQEALPVPASATPQFGGPADWSNRHVIYTRNGSVEDMLRLRDDPRFLNSLRVHYARAHRTQLQPANEGLNEAGASDAGLNVDTSRGGPQEFQPLGPWGPIKDRPVPALKLNRSKVDWNISLGPTAGMAIGETPAVYTYNYSTPTCSNLTATPPVAGDFIVYTINAGASVGTQANLVGLTNMYTNTSGTGYCSGTGPSFLFSYAIGSGGSPLSPVVSLDGTKVAWIENRTATTSFLHITTWAANQGGSATSPVAVTGTFSSGSCSPAGSSCDDAIPYTASTYPGCTSAYIAANGHSDLYVDYPSDSGFISANNGLLYHIKDIFSTTSAPSVDFCVPVNTTFEAAPSSAMSGPVYDPLLKEVFITDSETIYAYLVNASTPTPNFALKGSHTYGLSYNYQTGPGPLLDAFNNYIYVFSTDDTTGATSVTQLTTGLATPTRVPLGGRSTNASRILFYGAFDNNYYTYGPANAASTLYSCGTDTTATAQDLFAISFSPATGLANTTPAMSNNRNVNGGGTSSGVCSPITEFYDGTNDRIFVGMGQPAATSGSDIVTMWNVNSRPTSATTPTATATGYLGGTSGMSADNATTAAQAENVYFSTEETGTVATNVAGVGYNVYGIYTDGSTFPQTGGLDDDGNAYSSTELGTSVTWNGTTFPLGPANSLDAWQNTTITLPTGQYSTLEILGNAVNGNLTSQKFIVTYTDNTTTTFTQSVSDWYTPQTYTGESIAKTTAYRNVYNGTKDNRTFDLYGYTFALNSSKTVKSLTLPGVASGTTDNVVVVLAVALTYNGYSAVKLTQGALQ